MTFLISFYYNLTEVKIESYNHIRKYLLFANSIAAFKDDVIIQDLWAARSHSNITIEDKKHLILHLTGKPSIRIETSIFKTCYLQHMNRFKKDHFQPDYRFTLSRIVRECFQPEGQPVDEVGLSDNQKSAFPHFYAMKDEELTENLLFAKHEEPSSDFHLFLSQKGTQRAGEKYDENYLATLEKNFWGTQFTLWDNGLPQPSLEKLPEGFASGRKKLVGNLNIFLFLATF